MISKLPKGLNIIPSGAIQGVNTTIARLYDTNIVTIEDIGDKKLLTLNSGGWKTKHTKKCINVLFTLYNLPYKLYQKDFTWYLTNNNGEVTEFQDNIELIA